jgi:hypothetical protein
MALTWWSDEPGDREAERLAVNVRVPIGPGGAPIMPTGPVIGPIVGPAPVSSTTAGEPVPPVRRPRGRPRKAV